MPIEHFFQVRKDRPAGSEESVEVSIENLINMPRRKLKRERVAIVQPDKAIPMILVSGESSDLGKKILALDRTDACPTQVIELACERLQVPQSGWVFHDW